MTQFKQITQSQMKELRWKQFLKQGCQCAVLKKVIEFEDSVFDHKHKRKDEPIGENGKGLLRGVIHRNVNQLEGKIQRFYKRYALDKLIPLPELLRNLASYLERPPMKPIYIHPNEIVKIKPKKLSRKSYNTILLFYFDVYPRKRKLPEYPFEGNEKKEGNMTKEFEKVIEDFEKWLQEQYKLIKQCYFMMYPRRRKLPKFPEGINVSQNLMEVLFELKRRGIK